MLSILEVANYPAGIGEKLTKEYKPRAGDILSWAPNKHVKWVITGEKEGLYYTIYGFHNPDNYHCASFEANASVPYFWGRVGHQGNSG